MIGVEIIRELSYGTLFSSFYTALAVGLFVAFTNHSASAKSSGSCQHAPITIKAGQKYNKARKQLMNNGWQPIIVNPNERANTGQEEDLAQMGFVEVISRVVQDLFFVTMRFPINILTNWKSERREKFGSRIQFLPSLHLHSNVTMKSIGRGATPPPRIFRGRMASPTGFGRLLAWRR